MTTADVIHDDRAEIEHEAPSYDDINTPVIVLVGAISALVTLLTIMFVQGLYYHWQNSYLKQRDAEVVSMPANEQINTQKSLLVSGEGLAPISESMQKIIAKYGK